MRDKRRFPTAALSFTTAALGLSLLALACGSGGKGDADAFFALEDADATADAALPVVADLPGEGWEETARYKEDPEEESDSGDDFTAAVEEIPECAELAALSDLGGVFGEDADEPPAGTATVEFERASPDTFMPSSIEVSVELEETVSEVQGSWGIVREILEAPATKACFEKVFNAAFLASLEADGEAPPGLEASLTTASPSVETPHEGGAMAFDMDVSVLGIDIEATLEIYFWPYANGAVTVMFVGERQAISGDEISDILAAIDRKVAAAAKAD